MAEDGTAIDGHGDVRVKVAKGRRAEAKALEAGAMRVLLRNVPKQVCCLRHIELPQNHQRVAMRRQVQATVETKAGLSGLFAGGVHGQADGGGVVAEGGRPGFERNCQGCRIGAQGQELERHDRDGWHGDYDRSRRRWHRRDAAQSIGELVESRCTDDRNALKFAHLSLPLGLVKWQCWFPQPSKFA